MARSRTTIVAALMLLIVPLAGCMGGPQETPTPGPEGELEEGTEPHVRFDFSCAFLTCHFDASNSSDPDGETVGYEWEFGDDETGTGEEVNHTYEDAGTYNVTLTVTDDQNLTANATRTVNVTLDGGGDGEGERNRTEGNGTEENETTLQDQRWTWNGTVGPDHDETFTFPVNATPVDHVLVRYELEDDLGAGRVELTLSNPNGTTLRRGNVSQANSPVTWNLTGEEAGVEGMWTVRAQGFGVPADGAGTHYNLLAEVAYPPTR